VPAAVGRGAQGFWFGLSVGTRRRLVASLGAVALIVLIWLIAIPALPCQAPGGDTCAPTDDAIGLVPDDALGYVHVNASPGTEQFEQAEQIASQVPELSTQVVDRLLSPLLGPRGSAPDFAREIQPWFGGEAALAIVPARGGGEQEVELLEASDTGGAQKFAESVTSGGPRTSSYRGVPVQVGRRGLASALVGGFLAIGTRSGVRDVIDAQSGATGTASLADDPAARDARDTLPDTRLADVYLSQTGIAKLVANPHGPLRTFAALISPGASRGMAAALVAGGDGLDLQVRSELDPSHAQKHPGFFSAFPLFEPTLASMLPADSLGYLGIADPGKTLGSLLEQARAREPGLSAAVGALTKRVKELGKVNLQRDLLPSLGGEAAFAMGTAPSSGAPFIMFVGTGIEGARATKALARLQGPIAKALNPTRQAPVFGQHQVGDVTAYSLRVSPTVNLTYAIVGSTLVIATDPAGVEQIVARESTLDGTDLFREATHQLPGAASALGYLNLDGLISLGERAGLAQDPAYATFAPEIRKLQALGVAVQSSSDELATDLRLIVGSGPQTGGSPGGAPTG
jgi:uncharacterized protein DUF3352